MLTHGWADSHQMCICGSNQDGLSNVPALIHARSGVAATLETMAEPHSGQNLRSPAGRSPPRPRTPQGRAPPGAGSPSGRRRASRKPSSSASGSGGSGTPNSRRAPPRSRSERRRTSNRRRSVSHPTSLSPSPKGGTGPSPQPPSNVVLRSLDEAAPPRCPTGGQRHRSPAGTAAPSCVPSPTWRPAAPGRGWRSSAA
jgi:hypothetical protein